MTLLSRRDLLGAALAAPLGALAQPATPWPVRPVRLLVGFPPGSTPDLSARALAEPLARALGQPVVVENRPGAGGNVAAQAVALATDGHTLGLMINGNLTVARLLNPRLGFDPTRDLAPVSLVGTAPLVLAAPADGHPPAETLTAVLAAGRRAGRDWNYGSPGVGTMAHLGMELLAARTGLSPVHVPYPGNPQVIQAMLGGQLQLALLPPGLVAPQVRAGRLRALAVTSAGRSLLTPEWPSLAELGVPGVQLEIWNAVAAPATLSPAVVRRVSALVGEIVRAPEMRQRLFQQGWQVAGTSPEGLANRMAAETAALGRVVREQGVRVE